MYDGALSMPFMAGPLTAVAVSANTLMTAVAGILFVRPFLGQIKSGATAYHEAQAVLFGGPLLLGGTGILFGIIPDWVGTWLVQPAVRALGHGDPSVEFAVYHGPSLPLLLSVVTLSVGAICYWARGRIAHGVQRVSTFWPLPCDPFYQGFLKIIPLIGRWQTRGLQNGSLHRYLFLVVASLVGLCTWRLMAAGPKLMLPAMPAMGYQEWLLVGLVAAAVAAVVVTNKRLVAISSLGVVGAGLALIFLIYGAPDVALTQLLVETLTVIIVAVVLLRLPDLKSRECGDRPVRLVDGLLAAAAGTVVALMLLNVTALPLDRGVTAFYEQQSLTAAHGRNIVNVILV
ncbi:MAG: hydrogen gas-evolving membrane-bound hydrogenase subunit E, partial [Oceanisphaera sp.]|nr:hydrogen gas-evolving membrane-bound hydrogenase subunit E [Oceanisphaera sp.]